MYFFDTEYTKKFENRDGLFNLFQNMQKGTLNPIFNTTKDLIYMDPYLKFKYYGADCM